MCVVTRVLNLLTTAVMTQSVWQIMLYREDQSAGKAKGQGGQDARENIMKEGSCTGKYYDNDRIVMKNTSRRSILFYFIFYR